MATFYTGNTGRSTGPHLDFRVWDVNKGGYVDPSRFTDRMMVGDQKLTDMFEVTSPYGADRGSYIHKGIDYATPVGTGITITGGKYLGTFNDKGGGITSQYGITDDEGNPFEILLMHGNKNNKITMDSANTSGQPVVQNNTDSTPKPEGGTATPSQQEFTTPEAINAEYDRMRMAGDIGDAEKFGMEKWKQMFDK
nr:hypothetical protein 10 [Pelagibacteraceae bacterium]